MMAFFKPGQDPKIIPANATHLIVSWDDVFVDCDDSAVKVLEVHVKTRQGGFNEIETGVQFSQMEVGKTFISDTNICNNIWSFPGLIKKSSKYKLCATPRVYTRSP